MLPGPRRCQNRSVFGGSTVQSLSGSVPKWPSRGQRFWTLKCGPRCHGLSKFLSGCIPKAAEAAAGLIIPKPAGHHMTNT
jgi:hypothetical protein